MGVERNASYSAAYAGRKFFVTQPHRDDATFPNFSLRGRFRASCGHGTFAAGDVTVSKRGQRRGKAFARQRREAAANANASATAQPASFDGNFANPDPNFSLFHYTTASGLIGIVSSQTLWATHAQFLNDTAECQLLTKLLTPQIEEEFRNIVPALTEVGAFKPELMSKLGGDDMATEAERVVNSILRAIDKSSPIHIASFCLHPVKSPESEHGLLSQWRGYAKGGFAIEFDEGGIDELIHDEMKRYAYQTLKTDRVAYENHSEVANVPAFKGMANASLKGLFESVAPKLSAREDVARILGTQDLADYITPFAMAVPFLKGPRFREEAEYRIVALPIRSKELAAKVDDRPWKSSNFREDPTGAVVPYIELFKGAQPLPIKKVIVGPHRDQANQKLAAEMLLEKHGIRVPVIVSDTTLRH